MNGSKQIKLNIVLERYLPFSMTTNHTKFTENSAARAGTQRSNQLEHRHINFIEHTEQDLRRNHNKNIPIPRIKTSETSQAKTTAHQSAKQSFSSEAEKTKTSPQIYHTTRSRLTQEFNPPCYERLLTRVRPLMHHKDSSTTPHSHPIK